MPRNENYHYSHAYYTPEPHCIPGYTGYLPGFGPHKHYQFGKTYGRMTHDIMERHPIAGGRFGHILKCNDDGKKQDDDFYVWKHERSSCDPIHRRDMMPGYTGHVPRKDFHSGKGYKDECCKGIAEFERLKEDRNDRHMSTKYIPPEDLLLGCPCLNQYFSGGTQQTGVVLRYRDDEYLKLMPRNITFSRRLCERPKHREIPSYATFTNPMNYGQSVYDMSDLDPRKTYMPGYTGYYTGKCFDTGVTHSRGAHQDLCDLTSSKLERLVIEKRPKINDWYRCPVLYPPRPPELEGYHPPCFEPSNPVPGYAGHIPGYRDCCLGESFGKSAGTILRNRELICCDGLRKP